MRVRISLHYNPVFVDNASYAYEIVCWFNCFYIYFFYLYLIFTSGHCINFFFFLRWVRAWFFMCRFSNHFLCILGAFYLIFTVMQYYPQSPYQIISSPHLRKCHNLYNLDNSYTVAIVKRNDGKVSLWLSGTPLLISNLQVVVWV